MTRRETIVALLETYQDVLLDGTGEGITTRADSRALEMSKLYHQGSYRELERCLALMKDSRPSVYAHVQARFFRRQTRVMTVPYKRHKKGIVAKLPAHSCIESGTPTLDAHGSCRVRLTQWEPWVKNQKVERGIDFLCRVMQDPVQLPLELLPAA